jgi:hypothetical protein
MVLVIIAFEHGSMYFEKYLLAPSDEILIRLFCVTKHDAKGLPNRSLFSYFPRYSPLLRRSIRSQSKRNLSQAGRTKCRWNQTILYGL